MSDIKKISTAFVDNNIALNIFSRKFKQKYINSCIEFLKQFVINKTNKDIIIKDLLRYYKSWDLYALSVLYLKFLGYIFHTGFYDSKIIIKFSQLLLVNISPDPKNRLSIDDIKRLYKDIFFIFFSTINYLELINNFKYKSIPVQKILKEMSVLYTKPS